MLRTAGTIAMSLALSALGGASPAHAVVPFSAAPPAAPPSAPTPTADLPDVEAAQDRAMTALATGSPDTALVDLDFVAANSNDPRRRADASALAVRIRSRPSGAAVSRAGTPAPRQAPTPAPTPTPAPGASPPPAGAAPSAPTTAEEPDQAGRTVFLATTTLLGLTAYGWTVPTALDIQSNKTFLALYMLTAGTSFVAPYLLTRHQELTWGTTNAAWYGGTRGILHGAMIGGLINPHGSDRGTAAAILFGSALELTGTAVWGQTYDPAPATVRTMAWAGDFGLLWGMGIAHLTGADLHDRNPSRNDAGTRLLLASGLAGNVGGVLLGKMLAGADQRVVTWGDGEVNRAAGLVGVLAGAAVADWFDAFDKDYSRAYVGAMLTGSALGLYFGHRLAVRTDFSVGRAVLVDLGTLAGGLLGAGITYLATPDGTDDLTPFVSAAAGGAVLGFALTTYSLGVPGSLDATADARSTTGVIPQLVPMLGHSGQRGLAIAGMF